MKKLILLLVVLASTFTFAQNNGITYQAVIYSTNGESVPGVKNTNSPLTNKAICLQFSIGDTNSSTEYQEKVTVTTDEYGMVNLVIGTGTQTGGFATSFNTINWASSQKYLKVSVDQSGNCFSFESISNQILTYVPYALAANSAASVSGVVGIANGGTNATTVVGAKTNLSLQNVDNTTDLNKPLSTATQTALATKVDKVSGKELSSNDYTTVEKTKLAAITGTNTGDQDLSLFATATSIALKANTTDLTTGLATKVDKVTGKDLSSNDYTTEEKTKLATITGTNTGDQDLSLFAKATSIALKANTADVTTGLATKVDKVSGKELSSNDYTTVEKTKLAAITGNNTGDQDLTLYATNINLALKANTASPSLSGIPTAPTAASGTNSTQLATTAFVTNAVNNSAGGSFVDLTTNQTIGGRKTFSSDLKVNGLTVGIGGGAQTSNVVFGNSAMANNSLGGYSVAIGLDALKSNIDGNSNTAVGYQALSSNTVGYGNIALGMITMKNNINGSQNVAIGNATLINNTSASGNTVIGYSAATNISTGGSNTIIGQEAAGGLTTGSWNTIIGRAYTGNISNNIVLSNGLGDIKAQHDGNGWKLSGRMVMSTATIEYSQLNNYDVSNISILFVKPNSTSTNIYGLKGGVLGQVIHIYSVNNQTSNSSSGLSLWDHDTSSSGIQKFVAPEGINIDSNENTTLVFDGTYWRVSKLGGM